jgi:ribosomal protein S18 acetylase RimI-like enzyme
MKCVLLFVLLIGQNIFAQNACRSLFQSEFQGYFKTDLKSQDRLHFVSTDPSEYKVQNKIVGTVEFEYFEHSDKLMVHWIEVSPLVRQKGISKKLVQALLEDFSETKEIVAYLTDSNFKIFKDHFAMAKSLTESVKHTPFYKSFAELGFSEVSYVNFIDDKVILNLKKEFSKGR